MNHSNLLPIFYAVLWSITSLGYFLLKRRFDLGALMISIYTGSAWVSVYYYSISYVMPQYSSLDMNMYLFLFAGITICMLPYLNYDFQSPVNLSSTGYERTSYYFALLLAILGIPTVIEHLYHIITIGVGGDTYFGELYSGDVSAHTYLSWFSRKSNFILMKCQSLVSVFLVYYAIRKRYILASGLFLAFLSNLLAPYNAGSRGGIVFGLASLLVSVMVLEGSFPRQIYKKVFRFVFLGMGYMAFIILTISISRYNYNEDYSYRNSVWEWVALYVGEGSLRFANDLNGLTIFADGCDVFGALCDNSFATEVEQDLFFHQTGVRVNVFYTFLGDFFLDFGIQGVMWFCMAFFLTSLFLFQNSKVITLDIIILRLLFAQVIVLGFTAFPYRGNLLVGIFLWPFVVSICIYILRTTASLYYQHSKT